MARTISRAEFARYARVSKPAITKWLAKHPASRAGDRVHLDDADVVAYLRDKGHEVSSVPAAAAPPAQSPPAPSAADTAAAPTKTAKRPKGAPSTPTDPPKVARHKPTAPTALGPSSADELPRGKRPGLPKRGAPPTPDEQGFADELADLTLIQICARYGTVSTYKVHLEAFEKRERALKYRLENEEAEGRLIERELVSRVIGAFDGANRRLLGDGPKTISRRLYAMARAQDPVEQAEATVHEIISSILKAVKTAVRDVIDGD